jgi:hypothetical protein
VIVRHQNARFDHARGILRQERVPEG